MAIRKTAVLSLACTVLMGCSPSNIVSEAELLLLVGTQNGEKATIVSVRPQEQTLKVLSSELENRSRFFSPQSLDLIFGVSGNTLQAFQVNPETYMFDVRAETKEGLGGPTSVDHSVENQIVLTAHFREGLLTARSYNEEGFGTPQTFECGEAHHFRFHPSGKWAYAACREQTVRQFSVDPATGTLTPMQPAQLTAEDGPRHIDFHPNGRVMYLLLEKSSEIGVFDIDQKSGALSPRSPLYVPMTTSGEGSKSSDLHITPNGKWLYGFNRDSQTMARYAVASSGALKFLGETEMQRGVVRRWAMDPEGRFLVTASYDGYVTLWNIDNGTGKLKKSNEISGVGKASWAGFIDPRD